MNLLRRVTIGDIPKRTAAQCPDRTAIIFQGKRISFQELNENCCRFAHSFEALGAQKGDRVAFLAHNCLQYIYAWLGMAKIGCTIVPLNFMLKPFEVEFIINHAEPRFFFVEDALVPPVLEVAGKLKSVEKFGIIPLTGAKGPEGWLNLDDFLAPARSAEEPCVEVDGDEMTTILYTSGTEALPKGVMTTHQNYYAALMSGAVDLNINKSDITLLTIPLYHVAGKYLLLESISIGATVVLQYAPNPTEILQLTQEEKVTYWVYPPTLYQILPVMPNFKDFSLSSLRKCISFGALMPVALLQQWKKLVPQAEWRNYYGQTESSPLGSTLQPVDFERKISSIGTPHMGVEMKIFDENDQEVPAGQVGEVVLRGPCVMKGYFKNEAKTAETLRNGWLHTGDLGRFDDEGFLYFIDRKKDMIKTGGENVSSQEVEGLLFKQGKIMQAAVIGMPDKIWGEAVTAVVVPFPGTALTEEEIIAYCKANMAGYKVPKKVIFVPSMPTTPSGKVLKRLLKEQIMKQT
jgi:fatty-acyl-CoA synthase